MKHTIQNNKFHTISHNHISLPSATNSNLKTNNLHDTVFNKSPYNYFHFTYESFSSESFINKILNHFHLNTTYSILIKVSSNNNLNFKMCGSQIGIVIKEDHNIKFYESLFSTIEYRIETVINNYDYMNSLDLIEIAYCTINPPQDLKLTNIKELEFPSYIVNVEKVKKNFNENVLPLTTNERYFGEKLSIHNPNYNTFKEILQRVAIFNSTTLSHDTNLIFDENDSLYLYKPRKPFKNITEVFIQSKKINDKTYIRNIFTLTGLNLVSVEDTLIQQDHNNITILNNTETDLTERAFYRQINNTRLLIENQSVKETSLIVPVSNIKNYINKTSSTRNIRFGAFDLETFVDVDGLAKVYALGFITYEDKNSKLFYLDRISKEKSNMDNDSLNDSDKLILKCLDNMLTAKYDKFIFYTHNLGKYDVVFIYRTLLKYNKCVRYDYYKLNTVLRENVIIKLEIKIDTNIKKGPSEINNENDTNTPFDHLEPTSTWKSPPIKRVQLGGDKPLDSAHMNHLRSGESLRKVDDFTECEANTLKLNRPTYIKIIFIDSLNLLNNSLEKLAKDFKIPLKKGFFPYRFVKANTLNYIGTTPKRSYYNDIPLTEYRQLKKKDWNLKEECLTYLNNDLLCLQSIMNEFSKIINIYYNSDITEAMTITRLALNIFFKNYYKPEKAIDKSSRLPLINKLYLYNFIKQAYFGGITEVYKPYGENLAYIDVNSLYPFVALKDLPGNYCTYLESFNNEGLNLNNLFGFFYARVKTNNQYFGLLPIHDEKDNLICPEGQFEGIWSSIELQFAKENGYDITIIKGYNFNVLEHNPFKEYINDLYDTKRNSTGSLKTITKSLLNNLLGRFGLSIIKPISRIVKPKEKDIISSTREMYSVKVIDNQNFLISYNPTISKQICNEHGLNYIKVLNKEKNLNIERSLDLFKDVSIAIVAMITAHARIFLHKIKLEILKNKGNIYYTDTDSLILDKNKLQSEWIGQEIGQFKLEFDNIKEGYFISNKTYCLVLDDNTTIIKAKGIINKDLTRENFISMYKDNLNINTMKTNTDINYEKGSVIIEKKKVVLNYNSYTKRNKIYNENGLWIDTKPLLLKKDTDNMSDS